MIDHIEISVSDQYSAKLFYQRALAPLGYVLHVDGAVAGFGTAPGQLNFWLRHGGPSIPPPHIAFGCENRRLVDLAHTAAVAAGGRLISAPRLIPQVHPNYYAGTLFDLDGHNIEFACHRHE